MLVNGIRFTATAVTSHAISSSQNTYLLGAVREAARPRRQAPPIPTRRRVGLNPNAARGLEEFMEKTLMVHELRVTGQLRLTLSSTNVIESAFSVVETVCPNVKRWLDGDQIGRLVGSELRQLWKVIGCRQIPMPLSSMVNAASQKPTAKETAVA